MQLCCTAVVAIQSAKRQFLKFEDELPEGPHRVSYACFSKGQSYPQEAPVSMLWFVVTPASLMSPGVSL